MYYLNHSPNLFYNTHYPLKNIWKNVESIIVGKTKVHESMTYVILLPSIPFTECHQKNVDLDAGLPILS